MHRPLSSWFRLLQSLGLQPKQLAKRSFEKRSAAKQFGIARQPYESLEPRQLLAGDAQFFVIDSLFDRSFQYDVDGQSEGNYSISESRAARGTAISADGQFQFVVDANRTVHIFDIDSQQQVGQWRTQGVAAPQGIAVDGEDLLIVDRAYDRVFRFENATTLRDGQHRPDSSFKLRHGNRQPSGIATIGDRIWVVDRGNDRVYVYGERGERLGNWRLDTRNKRPTGIAVDPDNDDGLWVVDEQDNRVYYYENGQMHRRGRHESTNSFRLRSYNWFPQGLTIAPGETVRPAAPAILAITEDTGNDSTDGITADLNLLVRGTADPGTTIELVSDQDGSLGTAQTDADGNWTIDATTFDLVDGEYLLTATASNLNGVSDPSNSFRVIVDTVAPAQPQVTRIDEDLGLSSTDGITSDNTLWVFGRAEPNSVITLSENGLGEVAVVQVDADGNWQADRTGEPFADGEYLFTATATDAAGNVSVASAGLSVQVDTVAPVQPVINAISDDTGRSANDGITRTETQTISGTAEPNTTLRLFDGSLEVASLVTPSSGSWSTTVTLAEGQHELTATSEDIAGNVSDSSESFSIQIDITTPDTPLIVSITEDTNLVDGVTSDAQFSINGASEPFAKVTISELSLGEIGSTIADGSGSWTLPLPNALVDSQYQFTATCEDVAGNLSPVSNSFEVTLDTIAPAAPSIFVVDQDTGTSSSDGITQDPTLVFSGMAESGAVVTLFESSIGVIGTTTADAFGTWTIDASDDPFADGSYQLSATSTDLAGNVSASSAVFFLVVDASSPLAPVIVNIEADTGVDDDGVTADDSLIFFGTGETGVAISLIESTLGILGDTTVDADGNWSVDLTDQPLVNGSYLFTATATDVAGNVSVNSDPFTVVVDTDNPGTPSIVRVDDDSGPDNDDAITNDPTLVFSGMGPLNSTIQLYESDLGLIGTTSVDASGTWNYDASSDPLNDGVYEFTAVAIDLAGNLSPVSSSLWVTIDTLAPVPPTIDQFTDDTGSDSADGITADTTPTFLGSAEPASMVKILDAMLGELASLLADENGQWQLQLPSLADGSYQISAVSIDAAGNSSGNSSPLQLTVDTIAPSVPAVVRVTNDTGADNTDGVTSDNMLSVSGIGAAGETVVLTELSLGFEASTTIASDGTWTIDATIITLADGEYDFIAHSIDLAGNQSDDSNPLNVVIDTSAPIAPMVDLAVDSDTGIQGDLKTDSALVALEGVTEVGATVSLLETGQTTTADQNGDFEFADVALVDGFNTFTITATDLAGNESSTSLQIEKTNTTTLPQVSVQLLNDTGSSARDLYTSDPTLVGNITHPNPFTAELVLEVEGPAGIEELRADMTALIDANGEFQIDPSFMAAMFPSGDLSFGFYRYVIEATDASNQNSIGFHFGEMFYVPSGADSPPISVNVGLLNDTGPIATDRLSTDPTLFGFVETDNLQAVEFYYDTGGQGLFADITSLVDSNGDFTLDQAFLESVIGGPLGFQRHDYHIVAVDNDGNFAFKYNHFGFLESDDDDITAPELSISLTNDTGSNIDDQITNDLSITGSVVDESDVSLSVFVFNTDTFEEFGADVSELLDANGNFEITQSRLESIAGGPLTDGAYQIDVTAEDRYSRTTKTIIAQLDTSTASIPTIESIETDTGTSDSDGITSDPLFAVVGSGDPFGRIELSEAGLGVLGIATADENGQWQFEITGAGLIDGDYEFTARGITLAGSTSDPSNAYQVTLDTDSPLRAIFDLDPAFDSGDAGDGYTTFEMVDLVGTTTAGALVELAETGQTTTADSTGRFRFANVPLKLGNHAYEVRTSDLAGNLQISKRRLTLDQPIELSDQSFVAEATRTISLGTSNEAKTIRFKIDAEFGPLSSSIQDSLQVYVVDPSNPGSTVIDRGTQGTSAFSLVGSQAELRNGVARFDGNYVEIDVTELALSEVTLRFQLINNDQDSTANISISELGFYTDPSAVASPVGQATREINPGATVDLNSLSANNDLVLSYENIRFDSASDQFAAAIRVTNQGVDLGRSVVATFANLPAGVTITNASGVDSSGNPYINLEDAIPVYGLLGGQSTELVVVQFSASSTSPLVGEVDLFDGGLATAPVIDAVGDLQMMPGEVLELQLTATGSPGFYFTMNNDGLLPDMTLQPDGRLRVTPKPGQQGSYQFDVFATDGVRSTSETIVLDVVDDTDTTSRISGVVMDTLSNPLAGVPVELGGLTVNTAADGTFELAFAGGLPDDALRIHGEAYVGSEVYPFVAEKLPLLFGHEPFDNINNVISRPIYLPALDVDNGVTIDPAVDVTVTTTNIPGASVFVEAGSLESQNGGLFTGELSITEVPNDFTPAALPFDLFPDMVVTIQPGEMLFNVPAPLNLPNLSGYPAGTEMVLWSINPITGLFDNVGTGVVSADGNVVETVSGGIRNSSWHLFSPNPASTVDASENPNNEDKACDPCARYGSPNQQPNRENSYDSSGHFPDDNPLLGETQEDFLRNRRNGRGNNEAGGQTSDPDFGDRVSSAGNGAESGSRTRHRSDSNDDSSTGSSSSESTAARSGSSNYSNTGSGLGTGWGSGGNVVLGSKGDFGPYGSWDFSKKPTFDFGYNVVADQTPTVDGATNPAHETSVSLHSGAVHKSHNVVSYQSLGQWRGIELHYDSERADSRPILSVGIDQILPSPSTKLVAKVVVARGNMRMTVPGFQGTQTGLSGGEHFFNIPDDATSVDASIQADLNHLPSGLYTYETTSRIARGSNFSGTSTTSSDRLIHVNYEESEFGAGWGMAGLTQLVENPDGSVLMIDGDGGELLFSASLSANQPYISPAEDFSTLIKLPSGLFQRTHIDQTVEEFSPTNKLTSVTDRNGNQTQFLYNAENKLDSIVDPVGLVTEFRYTDGRITEIEDPAGRITRLTYENGNLVGIEDPDSSSKSYRYDSASRLIGETDKLGNSESIQIDFAGRAQSLTRKDGNVIEYSPVQTLNLFRPELTSDPNTTVETTNYRDNPTSQESDANGNVTQVVLDKAGQLTGSRDGEGNLPDIARNENNLVQRTVDARGNVTILEYDENGNVTLISDEIARQNRNLVPFSDETQSVTSVDANGDGNLDLVVALPNTNSIGVSYGNGDGTFAEPLEFFAGFVPSNVESVDLNDDGFSDVVVTSLPDQRVSVLYNDGFGFFEIGFAATLPDPTTIEFGDLDGDNDLDIVVGGQRQYSTMMNNGDGSFATSTTSLASQTGSNRIALGDFDSDGAIDLAIGAPEFSRNTNQIEIHHGLGDGTFSFNASIDVLGGSDENVDWFLTELSVADIDADGVLDLLATTPFTNELITNNVAISFGVGDGSFESPVGLASGVSPQSVEAGDFNDDGIVDLVTANRDDGQATVSFGDGNRQFGNTFEYRADAGSSEVTVGDFNSDGLDDFAVANFAASNVSVHFPQTSAKIFEYDPVFNQLTRTIDELGRQVLYDIDPTNGNRLSRTQVIGEVGGADDIVMSMTYNSQGQLQTITDPLGRVTQRDYNARGLVERMTFAVGTADEAFIEFEYDLVGNQTAVIDELGHRTEYVYDSLNRITQIIEADPDAAGPLVSPVTINEYDDQGNLIRTTDAENQTTQFVYDSQHRLIETIDANTQSIVHEYDAAGNMSATVDRLGRRTEFVYDQRNRLVETINAEGGKRLFFYDADNNRTATIDENGVRVEFTYDARNRLTSTTNALGGVVTYEYDSVDNLIASIDELGRRSEMDYDELNRMIETRGPDPDRDGPQSTPITTINYDKASNLVSTIDALGNESVIVYDQRDRVIQTIDPDPDGVGPLDAPVTSYEYDDAGRMVRATDPLGRQFQFVFDDLNRLVREIHPDPDGGGPFATPIVRYTYDQVDNRLTSQDALGNVTTFGYDNLHRQITVTGADPDSAGPLVAPVVTTVYDAEGQVIQKTDPLGRSTSYQYDDLGHVIQTTLPDPDGAGPGTSPVLTYSYDAVGNETSMIDALGNETIRVYDDLYRLVKTIEADPDGEVGPAEDRVTRYRYDAAHQLVSMTDGIDRTTRMEYDDLGRVVREIFADPDGSGPAQAPEMRYEFDLVDNQLAIVDALGNRTEFVYDSLYRLVQTIESDPDGVGPETNPVTTRVYDVASQLTTVTDPLGRTTRFDYDDLGRVVQQTLPDPDGVGPEDTPVMTFVYDLVGNELEMTDALGNVTRYAYDRLHRKVEVVEADPDGVGPEVNPVTRFSYDVASQLVSMTDALGRVTSMEYDDLGRQVKLTRPDPDGAGPSAAPELTYSFDNMDNMLSATDALGNTTQFVYDDLYRQIEVILPDPDDGGPQSNPTTRYEYDLVNQVTAVVDPLGRRSANEYDNLGRVVRTVTPDPDGAGPLAAPEMFYSFDAMNNLLTMTDAVGNVTRYEYDSLYRRVRIIESDPDGAGPLSQPISVMAYDVVDQLISQSDELGRTTSYQYDELGRVIRMQQPDPDGTGPQAAPEFQYSYDLMDNLLETIDPNGFSMAYEYDQLYRVVREFGEDLDGAGPLSQPVTEYSYDLRDNRTSVTDSDGNRTTYSFDELDRVFEETIELGAGNLVARSYEYDLQDNLIRKTDRNGRVTEYERDRLYRTVAERWYDELGTLTQTLEFEFDEASQLLRTEDVSVGSRYEFSYDDLGRVVNTLVNNGGPEVRFRSSYDAESRRTQHRASVSGVDDFVNDYQYDGLNRIVLMDQSGNGVSNKRFEFGYNAADQLNLLMRYNELSSDVSDLVFTSTYNFDGIGRLSQLSHQTQSTEFSDYSYAYDSGSRLTQIDHLVDGLSLFGYDNEDQVTSAIHDNQADESYQFDEDGNRLGGGNTTGFYNRLTSDGEFQFEYDNEGNRVKRTRIATGEVTEYRWDHRNRLIEVLDRANDGGSITQLVQHRYDPFNRWISKTVDLDGAGVGGSETTRYFYDARQIVLAIDSSDVVVNRYVWGVGADQLLADEQVGNEVYWTAPDHLGSVRDVVDGSGNVVNHIQYNSFGEVASQTNGLVDVLFGFTGKPLEKATGLQNNHHRWYDSSVGRWTSEDPITFAAGDANLYRYVGNNNQNATDPDGLEDDMIARIDAVGFSMRSTINHLGDHVRVMLRLRDATRRKQSLYFNQAAHIEAYEQAFGLGALRQRIVKSLEMSRLAADVYDVTVGGGVSGTDYVAKQIFDIPETGFYAALYQNQITCDVVVVFKGTDITSPADWIQNVKQGLGMQTAQYEYAMFLAKSAVHRFGEENVMFVGHSLGGGLATSASVVTKRPAFVVDPAGLHWKTVERNGGNIGDAAALVSGVRLWGEALTTAENSVPDWIAPNAKGDVLTIPTDKQIVKFARSSDTMQNVFTMPTTNHSADLMVENLEKILKRLDERIARE
ncbi:MAG: Ig-like domain-containing protein [Planctomycetota bacterium]